MNNSRPVFVLLVILGLLIAVALWQARPQTIVASTPIVDPRLAQTVFRGFTPDQIQALRIDDPTSDRDLILERDGESGWRLAGVENPDALDPVVADNIARTIAFIPYSERLPAINSDQYVHFGLTSETFWLQIQVILVTMETRSIVIGNLVPGTENGYYALVDEEDDVYILDRGAVEFLALHLREIQPFVIA